MKVAYAILGCHNTTLVNKCIQEVWLSDQGFIDLQEQEIKKQGKKLSFRQNLLMLNERDSRTLKQCYQELHVNRMKMGESEFLKENKHFEFSFKPCLSKNTA